MSMDLLVVGLSHHTAPISLRERLAVDASILEDELRRLRQAAKLDEVLLVSTCNRVELYATAHDADAAIRSAYGYLEERAKPESAHPHLYHRRGRDAVQHAFRVAASLDSMVVGEPQILGQVKEAFDAAAAAQTTGTLLSRCFTNAFGVAKRVRTETGIAAGMVSVSSIACELARKIFGDLRGRHTLLLGAGEMAEASARALATDGTHLVVVNRSPERARALADAFQGEARGYEHLASELVLADVVITSTSAQRFVLTHDMMRDVVKARRQRPLFLIDIAVPRDVDPRVGELESVFLYDVDDLQQVAEQNLADRKKETAVAERLVEEEVDRFEHWRRSLVLTPTIVALREQVQEVLRTELERTLPRLGHITDADRNALDKMCGAATNKILHRAIVELKADADSPGGAMLIDATRRLFGLDDDEKHQGRTERSAARVVDLAAAGTRREDE